MQQRASEVAKKWKLRGERKWISSYPLKLSETRLTGAVSMEVDLQSEASGNVQTSGTDNSEGLDFRKDLHTPPRPLWP
jgi:hypothetical protein